MVKNPRADAGDTGSVTDSGRSLGEGDSNPLQHSCLGNPMDKEAWGATVHAVTKRIRHELATRQEQYVYICMLCAQSLQSCPTLYNPVDCSLRGSSVHGVLQARILEWVARPSSRRPSDPGVELLLLHCRPTLYC